MANERDRFPKDPRTVVKNEGRTGMGMVVAVVILALGIIAAIWYFQSTGGSNTAADDVTITIDPNADPGTGTTIPG